MPHKTAFLRSKYVKLVFQSYTTLFYHISVNVCLCKVSSMLSMLHEHISNKYYLNVFI